MATIKFRGTIFGTCDRYEENDDGSCKELFEILLFAKDRRTLRKLKDDTKVTVTIGAKKAAKKGG